MEDIKNTTVTPGQCRAARGLLNWSQEFLGKKVRVGKTAIGDFERQKTTPYKKTLEDIKTAFEEAGIIFINNGEIGVKMDSGA